MKDLNDAMMKIVAGPEKRSRVALPKDLKITAIHEAGHAVAMYSLATHDPVRHISIIPRGRALGITWSLPREDSNHLTRNEMYEQIVGLLGGRVAEALFLQDISTGASNDIDRASKLARDMVARYGMCEKLGTVSYLNDSEVFIGRDYEKTKSYSEQVAGTIDEEVKALIDKAYKQCAEILSENEEKLNRIVSFLLENETMSGSQFEACMKGEEIPIIGRILCIADAFDAMTSIRNYKDAISQEEAVKELRAEAGRQFDPQLVRTFIELLESGEIKLAPKNPPTCETDAAEA
jgi:cell division protease FtsH